jgi:hypothetical protein
MNDMYIKKPIPVRAIQWNGPDDNEKVIPAGVYSDGFYWVVDSLEAQLKLTPGCWIVGPGARGEYWPVQDDIFRETYQKIE